MTSMMDQESTEGQVTLVLVEESIDHVKDLAHHRTREDFLAEFLSMSHQPCPGCGYELHALRGQCCPECGHALQLVVGLVNPNLRLFVTGLVGLGAALGISFATLGMVIYLTLMHGPAPYAWVYVLPIGMTIVTAVLTMLWFYLGARFRRLQTRVRVQLALSAWLVPIACFVVIVIAFEIL